MRPSELHRGKASSLPWYLTPNTRGVGNQSNVNGFVPIAQTSIGNPGRSIGNSHYDLPGQQCLCNRMGSVLCVKLENDVADVMVDCLDADQEIDGNLFVAFTQGKVSQNLYLPRRQSNALQSCIEALPDLLV